MMSFTPRPLTEQHRMPAPALLLTRINPLSSVSGSVSVRSMKVDINEWRMPTSIIAAGYSENSSRPVHQCIFSAAVMLFRTRCFRAAIVATIVWVGNAWRAAAWPSHLESALLGLRAQMSGFLHIPASYSLPCLLQSDLDTLTSNAASRRRCRGHRRCRFRGLRSWRPSPCRGRCPRRRARHVTG